ncbi:hypothetical protein M8C21_008423, partial [Ambrosia artemisiifolia]
SSHSFKQISVQKMDQTCPPAVESDSISERIALAMGQLQEIDPMMDETDPISESNPLGQQQQTVLIRAPSMSDVDFSYRAASSCPTSPHAMVKETYPPDDPDAELSELLAFAMGQRQEIDPTLMMDETGSTDSQLASTSESKLFGQQQQGVISRVTSFGDESYRRRSDMREETYPTSVKDNSK